MKQKLVIIILSIALVGLAAFTFLGKSKKQPKGLPPPDGVGIHDTVPAKAMWVDSLSDVIHYNEGAFIIRKGLVDVKTNKFIKQPEFKLLDENKKPIPKVKAIL